MVPTVYRILPIVGRSGDTKTTYACPVYNFSIVEQVS